MANDDELFGPEHVRVYRETGGERGYLWRGTTILLLTTTGRKSGEKFLFPLFYGKSGNSHFVIASKGGAPEHPGWYKNILANPEVEIQVGTDKIKARARTASGEERAKLWKAAAEFWPPYLDYQKKAPHREIPVVVLDPIS